MIIPRYCADCKTEEEITKSVYSNGCELEELCTEDEEFSQNYNNCCDDGEDEDNDLSFYNDDDVVSSKFASNSDDDSGV